MKTTVKILLLAVATLLMMACSKSDSIYEDSNMPDKKSSGTEFVEGTTFQLQGFSLYKTWAVKGGAILQDVKYENTGEIKFLGGRDFQFTFQETRPGGNTMVYKGKISASGVLDFHMPSPIFTFPDGTPFYITDVIKSHGCVTDLWGPGINEGSLYFKGRFDGNKLTAEAKFMATVIDKCPDLFSYEGNVHWIFGYDMNVVCD